MQLSPSLRSRSTRASQPLMPRVPETVLTVLPYPDAKRFPLFTPHLVDRLRAPLARSRE